MARLHCAKKGTSSSTRPTWLSEPEWVDYSQKEIENLIIKLANENYNSTMIGTILRDQYGIPYVKTFLKRSISDVLKEKGLYPEYPEDLLDLMKSRMLFQTLHNMENMRFLVYRILWESLHIYF